MSNEQRAMSAAAHITEPDKLKRLPFSPLMMKRFLAGLKHQTRRKEKPGSAPRYGDAGSILLITCDFWKNGAGADAQYWDAYTLILRGAGERPRRVTEPTWGKWVHQPAMLMPCRAAVVRARNLGWREQQLHDIDEVDARDEGVDPVEISPDGRASYRDGFFKVWRALHGDTEDCVVKAYSLELVAE